MQVGDRLELDRDIELGRVPSADIVMTSRGQGGRKNSGVRIVGTGHRLLHYGHQSPIGVNGRQIWKDHDLLHGDLVSPGESLVFRYVVDGGADRVSLGVLVDRCGRRLLFEPEAGGRCWRSVDVDEPAAEPLRAAFCADPAAVLAACASATVVARAHDVLIDGSDGQRRAVLLDDVAGASLDAILEATRAQGATVDVAVLATLLGPIAAFLASRPPRCQSPDPWTIHLTWDGLVRFDGVAQALLDDMAGRAGGDDDVDHAEAFARTLIDAGLLGPEPVLEEEVLHIGEHWEVRQNEHHERRVEALRLQVRSVPAFGLLLVQAFDRELVDVAAFWAAAAAWSAGFDVVPASTLRSLVRGLFPGRAAEEDALRERLAALDGAAIDALLAP